MKMLILSALLLLPLAGPEPASPRSAAQDNLPSPNPPAAPLPGRWAMPTLGQPAPGCRPLIQQVQDENARRAGDARTLDREPAAHGFLAVDRRVGQCREVTFLNGRGPPPADR